MRWGRDLDAALASSAKSGKPVFALFQEIPGCAGCKQFGRDVLSNPLLVEAIQGEGGYVVVRDTTCRLFGYHGLVGTDAFSLDHMFGF